MTGPLINKEFFWAAVLMMAFVIYGSLYPFHFEARVGAGPLTTLLTTGRPKLEHAGNLIGNIFFYVPVGLFCVLAIGDRIHGFLRLAIGVLVGTVLCVAMELSQFYDVGRVSTFADIYPNVLGSFLGSLAGLAVGSRLRWPPTRGLKVQPVPLLLLGAFLAYRLFPYVPSLDLHAYWRAVRPVVIDPDLSVYEVARYLMMWLLVAALGRTLVDAGRARVLLAPAMVGVLAAQVVIINNSLSAAELVGAVSAFVVWLAVGRLRVRAQSLVLALALAALVIAERLQPFDFLAAGHAFGWIPFSSFMHGSMAVNTQSFVEKFFLYGGLIWLMTRSGLGLGWSGVLVAVGLFATSLAQTHLPGRSAEITDATMALIMTGLFGLIGKSRKPAGSAHPS